jgi:hypothetical protein
MPRPRPTLQVQKVSCETCPYKPGSPLDPTDLEEAVRDARDPESFAGFRVCHSSHTACCAGFWVRHKDSFALGQLAQRLNRVELVQHTVATAISRQVKRLWAIKARAKTRRQS